MPTIPSDLPLEEVLDVALHTLQSEGIQLVEWGILLYCRMGVPLVVTVILYAFQSSTLPEGAFLTGLSFSCPG